MNYVIFFFKQNRADEVSISDWSSDVCSSDLFMAREYKADVTGITLSKEQHVVSNRRAEEAGLANSARFHLRDYREEQGRYDRIVSVGMLEHVGNLHYGEYFGKLNELLAEDGVCLVHSIGRMDQPGPINTWFPKYTFPGAYRPEKRP